MPGRLKAPRAGGAPVAAAVAVAGVLVAGASGFFPNKPPPNRLPAAPAAGAVVGAAVVLSTGFGGRPKNPPGDGAAGRNIAVS